MVHAQEVGIVGTWRQIHNLPEAKTVFHTYYVFHSNGTGHSHYWDNFNGKRDGPKFTWRKTEGDEYFVDRTLPIIGNEKPRRVSERVVLQENGNRIYYQNGTPNPNDHYLYRVK